ncbi:MAG: tryptophan synthase subunit alpha [Syntrophobacteraceae bacterium]|nr:tryptophan synthase subunit alpha [Syntrophobacteraceae bacterium]
MDRIRKMFQELGTKKEKALVGFVSAGDPDIPRSRELIRSMCRGGLDILELGVPFSDPTADGPVIQRSSKRALDAGVNLASVLELTGDLRRDVSIPIILFSYYNPILVYGADRLYRDALTAGADGLLVVDLPPEESEEMTSRWPGKDLCLIRLCAPTTPPQRMKTIAQAASGFLYLVSMTGVTGGSGLDLEEISRVTASLRACADGIPICVGFGISTPDQVRAVAALADGVVVGSAFERFIESHLEDPDPAEKLGAMVRELKAATRL